MENALWFTLILLNCFFFIQTEVGNTEITLQRNQNSKQVRFERRAIERGTLTQLKTTTDDSSEQRAMKSVKRKLHSLHRGSANNIYIVDRTQGELAPVVHTNAYKKQYPSCLTSQLDGKYTPQWHEGTVEPRLSGLVGTSVNSPDNRESG